MKMTTIGPLTRIEMDAHDARAFLARPPVAGAVARVTSIARGIAEREVAKRGPGHRVEVGAWHDGRQWVVACAIGPIRAAAMADWLQASDRAGPAHGGSVAAQEEMRWAMRAVMGADHEQAARAPPAPATPRMPRQTVGCGAVARARRPETMPAPDPMTKYLHADPPPLVRIPVEVIAHPSGASSIVHLTRLPCVGETVPLQSRHLRVTHVQHDGAGMLAGRVFVDDVAP